MMTQVKLDVSMKEALREAFRKIDDDLKEIEELHEEMDLMLYDVERRIARIRHRRA